MSQGKFLTTIIVSAAYTSGCWGTMVFKNPGVAVVTGIATFLIGCGLASYIVKNWKD